MIYVSTRGNAPELGFRDVILSRLASDGGLYLPKRWPKFDKEFMSELAGLSYAEVAKRIIYPFVGNEISQKALSRIVDKAYRNFSYPAITPLVQTNRNEWILELFHGPTLAFKDIVMQLFSSLTDSILENRKHKIAIIGATSGDTGGAAINAFKNLSNFDILILFPHRKISDIQIQRLQMTSVKDKNVHALAIDGTFDNCQALVKELFNHHSFRDKVALVWVNSINWGRIVAQIVYYFVSTIALRNPKEKPSYCVPSGNCGDIFSGYAAKKMGLPIDRLIIATNSNDIFSRALKTGNYESHSVLTTTSPSMDLQVSSNFERLLFESNHRNTEYVRKMMSSFAKSGSFIIPKATLDTIRKDFDAGHDMRMRVMLPIPLTV